MLRKILGASLLLFQLGAIGYARFVPSRYFCWAPFDAQNEFVIDARVGGRELTAEEIRRRYRRPQRGVDNRAVQHVKDIIIGYETTYGAGEGAEVVLRYRVNGGEERTWRWPQE
jgi:hypothetical protein